MNTRLIKETDVKGALHLWNTCSNEPDFLYKSLDEKTFRTKFMSKNDVYETHTFVTYNNNDILGFVSGVHMIDNPTAYITFSLVRHDLRLQGIGSSLVKTLENCLSAPQKDTKRIDIIFFNPINLEWILPYTNIHDHPNAPGVDKSSAAYPFFQALGYIDFACQNSYYRDITTYQYSDKILNKIDDLKTNDIIITLFNHDKHHGYEELLNDLNSPFWKKEITDTLVNNSFPVLIAEKNGLVIGFAGPLKVQKSLRGYFTGIGIHSGYRGYGAGSVLFSNLCMHLKLIGSHYMTLFTGENNPARNIYEREGFKIVRSWANMRKEL